MNKNGRLLGCVVPCKLAEVYVSETPAASVLMVEAAGTSETSTISHQSTQRNNPEDGHFTSRRENLKSHDIRIGI
jgi:hypothetical protein